MQRIDLIVAEPKHIGQRRCAIDIFIAIYVPNPASLAALSICWALQEPRDGLLLIN